jgi:hypothetical protein
MTSKYIVFENAGMVIFQEHNTHEEVRNRFHNDTPVSAGFAQIGLDGEIFFHCYGESISLKLKADTERDSKLLYKMFNDY